MATEPISKEIMELEGGNRQFSEDKVFIRASANLKFVNIFILNFAGFAPKILCA